MARHSDASARQRRNAGAWIQVAAALLWIPIAWLLADAVAAIADGEYGGITRSAAAIFALGALRATLDTLGARLAFRAARRSLSQARADAAAALASWSPLDATRPSSGFAASLLAEQADAIVPCRARYDTARLKVSVVPLVIACAVGWVSWAATLVLLLAGPVIPLFMALIGLRAREASRCQLGQVGDMNAFLLDRLRGLATIRAFGAVDRVAARLREEADGVRLRTMAVLRIAFLSSTVLELFAALGVAMVAVYVGFHLLGAYSFGTWTGELGLAGGLFVLLLAPAFFEPLRELAAAWHDRVSGEEAATALRRLAAGSGRVLPGADDAGVATSRHLRPPTVTIEGVSFAHSGARQAALDSLDLAIAAGEHVALLAQSGGGKTTLLSLIAGLAAPDAGTIRIAGQPLDAANAAALRGRIAWIGQNPHLFAGSLVANVRIGRQDVGSDRILEALDAVGLSAVMARRGPAELGEGGIGLSGGEALRLALARALVSPEADLVLADEPTAHLDAETARQVTEVLLALGRGRTMIVATHDPALAARMDRVIRLGDTALEDAA